jgi:hypothetical protein
MTKTLVLVLASLSAIFFVLSVLYYVELNIVVENWDYSPQGFTHSLNSLAKTFTMFAASIVIFVFLFLLLILCILLSLHK